VSGLLLVPPFFEQVLGLGSPWIRSWQMYHYAATQICWAEYSRVARDGQRIPLNRFTTLGHINRWNSPSDIRWLRKVDGVKKIGTQMCAAIGAETDIRVVGQCASEWGWVDAFDGEENLCPPSPPSTQKAKSGKKKGKAAENNKDKTEQVDKKKGKRKPGAKNTQGKTEEKAIQPNAKTPGQLKPAGALAKPARVTP
jgi:hypothetical protein